MTGKTIKAGIMGGAGYAGGELVRLLLQHPNVVLSFVHSRSNSGAYLHNVHHDLLGETDMRFSDSIDPAIDVLFLCLGHGAAKSFIKEQQVAKGIKVIDLSQDFRIADTDFLYALPEFNKALIPQASYLANPGCFATAIQLALLPLAKAQQLQEVHITGITGATGAGQQLQASSHFAWRTNNIQAYKSLVHQHLAEIKQTLSSAQANLPEINFIPWRGNFARGIYLTAYLKCSLSLDESYQLYEDFYAAAPFTFVSHSPIALKQVVNTNKCLVHLEYQEGKLIIHAAIDNLLKGASGQAVQNMNLLFGFDEQSGLHLKASAF